jgi:hypothetical protein
MILERQKENLELNDGEIHESFATVIDFDSADFLKQMLSKFYSDAVGSLIRETTSNALDSHREINSSEPIVVSFNTNEEGNYEFSVEDFGVGINKDTINNILRKYGKSTKRNSVNQLGAFGLGWKSPLAYTSGFYFIGRKDGIEIKCMMYEGEEDIKIDILHEGSTKERNGCKVIVPVKHSDRGDFIVKINEQLAYFENVYFNVQNLNNDFKIHREEDFQYSDLCKDGNLHICLDNVYYPIDFQKLGVDVINIPLGLRFSLTDGLFPVPNRESIKYTIEAKKIILDKINKVADWLADKYNKTIVDTKEIFDVMNHYNSSSRFLFLEEGLSVDIAKIVPYTSAKSLNFPKIAGLKVLSTAKLMSIQNSFLSEYKKEYSIYRNKISEEKNGYELDLSTVRSENDIYIFSDRLSSVKKDYIKSLPKYSSTTYIVKKKPYFILGSSSSNYLFDNSTFYRLLALSNIPKNQWRDAINDFFYVRDLIIKNRFIDVDKMVIPQSFIDSKKKSKGITISVKNQKQVGDVLGKTCVALERYSDVKSTKLVSELYKLDKIQKFPGTIVYSTLENYESLDKLYSLSKKDKVKFVVFSERELKSVREVKSHNLLNLEQFMKGENKLYKRLVTAQLIDRLRREHPYVFTKMHDLGVISTPLMVKIEALVQYRNKWFKNSNNPDIIDVMISLAEENNLFDPEIYSIYQEMKKTLKKLYFLDVCLKEFCGSYSSLDRDSKKIKVIVDLFKYHKEKVNLEHYDKPEVVEEAVEDVLETI